MMLKPHSTMSGRGDEDMNAHEQTDSPGQTTVNLLCSSAALPASGNPSRRVYSGPHGAPQTLNSLFVARMVVEA